MDTGNTGDIHHAAYKSFHTRTPHEAGTVGARVGSAVKLLDCVPIFAANPY